MSLFINTDYENITHQNTGVQRQSKYNFQSNLNVLREFVMN